MADSITFTYSVGDTVYMMRGSLPYACTVDKLIGTRDADATVLNVEVSVPGLTSPLTVLQSAVFASLQDLLDYLEANVVVAP